MLIKRNKDKKCLKPDLKFAYEYDESIKELRVKNDNEILAQYWPDKLTATRAIDTIRYRNRQLILSVIVFPSNISQLHLFRLIKSL